MIDSQRIFKIKKNRPCVFISDYGFVPVATKQDDQFIEYITQKPEKVGDDCLICVEGKIIKARLLRSSQALANAYFLVSLEVISGVVFKK